MVGSRVSTGGSVAVRGERGWIQNIEVMFREKKYIMNHVPVLNPPLFPPFLSFPRQLPLSEYIHSEHHTLFDCAISDSLAQFPASHNKREGSRVR